MPDLLSRPIVIGDIVHSGRLARMYRVSSVMVDGEFISRGASRFPAVLAYRLDVDGREVGSPVCLDIISTPEHFVTFHYHREGATV